MRAEDAGRAPRVVITDEIVDYITGELCPDILSMVETLRGEDRTRHLAALHARTRHALEVAFS